MRMRVCANGSGYLTASFTSPVRRYWPSPRPGFAAIPELDGVRIPQRHAHRWQQIRFAAYGWAVRNYDL